jgi:hypothetical protein
VGTPWMGRCHMVPIRRLQRQDPPWQSCLGKPYPLLSSACPQNVHRDALRITHHPRQPGGPGAEVAAGTRSTPPILATERGQRALAPSSSMYLLTRPRNRGRRRFPKIQMLTVAELFAGRQPQLPWLDPDAFRKAARETGSRQDSLPL